MLSAEIAGARRKQTKKAGVSSGLLESAKAFSGLTLGVLVPGAGSALAVLFAFLLAGITGQEPGTLQDRTQFRIGFKQGTGNTVTNGFGLTGYAATADIDLHVILVEELRKHQRLTDNHLQGLAREIIFNAAAIDFNVAASGIETGTRRGVLAAARAVIKLGGHDKLLTSLVREGQRLGALGSMRMVGTGIHLELLKHGTTQTILGKHTPDGKGQHVSGLLSKELVQRCFTQTAHIAGMTIILFLFQLVAGDLDLFAIDNDDHVAIVHVRSKFGLVLAAEAMGNLGGQTAKNLIVRIHHKPLMVDMLRSGAKRLHAEASPLLNLVERNV